MLKCLPTAHDNKSKCAQLRMDWGIIMYINCGMSANLQSWKKNKNAECVWDVCSIYIHESWRSVYTYNQFNWTLAPVDCNMRYICQLPALNISAITIHFSCTNSISICKFFYCYYYYYLKWKKKQFLQWNSVNDRNMLNYKKK